MLQAITISNFALIDELHLEFEPGLSIMSGETGSGKSIIVDALGMALGERASTEFIRQGAATARVEALFIVSPDSPVVPKLKSHGIDFDDQVVLVRELNVSGRNSCRVNGGLVTTTQLKDIGQNLVDIHGQHLHQSLLNPATHMSYLDSFGGKKQLELAKKVPDLYRQRQRLLGTIKHQDQLEQQRIQRIDMIKYQIEEIENASLIPGEKEDLELQKGRLQQREALLLLMASMYQLLYGSDRDQGALDLVAQSQSLAQQAATIDTELTPLSVDLSAILCQLEDLIPKLRLYQENLPTDSTQLVLVEERLQLIQLLSRKYGSSINEILSYATQIKSELLALQEKEKEYDSNLQELDLVTETLFQTCAELSQLRKKTAGKFEQKLARELYDLSMEKAKINVAGIKTFEPLSGCQGSLPEITHNGFDKIEFLLTANQGEDPRPLAKIASGGEIARVMLAIKTVLAGVDSVPTLIFDEIDAGIGGRAAQKVAQKLAHLGKYHQSICVTHLPQIASVGNQHYYIFKEINKGKTYTRVKLLSQRERVEELARMLAGNNITPVVIQHAKQLLGIIDRS